MYQIFFLFDHGLVQFRFALSFFLICRIHGSDVAGDRCVDNLQDLGQML
jgi:hypothetical protein